MFERLFGIQSDIHAGLKPPPGGQLDRPIRQVWLQSASSPWGGRRPPAAGCGSRGRSSRVTAVDWMMPVCVRPPVNRWVAGHVRVDGGIPMKKLAVVSLVAVVLLLTTAAPSLAWRGEVATGTAAARGSSSGSGWDRCGAIPTGATRTTTIRRRTIRLRTTLRTARRRPAGAHDVRAAGSVAGRPGPAPAPSAPQAYWYYCSASKAYYPSVQSCAEPWVKVPPRHE